ncbi:MAG: LCP family protein, partial [Eubacterium sp.]|nr:LCP family protein [Eubacterium sp.]
MSNEQFNGKDMENTIVPENAEKGVPAKTLTRKTADLSEYAEQIRAGIREEKDAPQAAPEENVQPEIEALVSGRAAEAAVAKRKKRRKIGLIVLAIVVLAIIAAVGAAYAVARMTVEEKLDLVFKTPKVSQNELSCVDVDGYVNILLLGVDARGQSTKSFGQANTDAIIIVSLNTKTNDINLISVYRDTYLKVADYTYNKINSAFVYGGGNNAMRMLNESLDLNIDQYIAFNFKMVVDLVNAVGGIEVDVDEIEIEGLNEYTNQTARNVNQKNYKLVEQPGLQTLEGVQAVAYGRIRKGVGDDFKRTDRMRIVISKVLEKIKKKNITEILAIMELCAKHVETNMSNNDLIGLAQRLAMFKINKSVGFPYDVTTGYIGKVSYVFPADLAGNVARLHEEMFGQTDYQVSDTCLEIAYVVAGARSSSSSTAPPDAE